MAEHLSSSLIQYREINTIFGNYLLVGTITKEKTIYVNEARRDNYLTIVTCPPTSLGRPVSFSEEDAYSVHFSYNDALVITVHVGCCKVLKILIDRGSSINILYRHALNQIEDTLEQARKLINPRIQSLLFDFDGSESHSPAQLSCRGPFQRRHRVLCSRHLIPYNAILRTLWIQMMRAIPSTHHQLLKYPTPFEMANIRGNQVMARMVAAIT